MGVALLAGPYTMKSTSELQRLLQTFLAPIFKDFTQAAKVLKTFTFKKNFNKQGRRNFPKSRRKILRTFGAILKASSAHGLMENIPYPKIFSFFLAIGSIQKQYY